MLSTCESEIKNYMFSQITKGKREVFSFQKELRKKEEVISKEDLNPNRVKDYILKLKITRLGQK
jgi:hypothetical protein